METEISAVRRKTFVIASTLLLLLQATLASAAEIYLHPEGDDGASGSEKQPVGSLQGAADAVLKAGPGKEPITVWIHGGRYASGKTVVLGKEFKGKRGAPIRFRAMEGAVPVFDAGLSLDVSAATEVTADERLSRLAPTARGEVLSLVVQNENARKALSRSSVRCSLSGQMLALARYPNVGFGHIDRIVDSGPKYARGRTKGEPPKWSLDSPIGGKFTLLEKETSQWESELGRTRVARMTGYLSYDWYRESHPLAKVQDGVLQIADYSRYGIRTAKNKPPRRVRVSNLLCELDEPGEFYFDTAESRLYLFPPQDSSSKMTLSIWGGPGPLKIQGASYISLEGMVFEGTGKGPAVVEVRDSAYVGLAGCTVRNSTRPGVVIRGGEKCGLRSCDLYDLPHHLTLDGGHVRSLTSSGHYAINCHFTQLAAADYYGKISIRGVGQLFKNNLVHNFPGQVMVFGDCDHLIEKNELFNIGFEEGDGGAIYSGASLWSWGNVLRHNFIHHLMCLPQAHPRGGIYPDDGDQGDTIVGNVFYKAAHRAVLLNGGAGHKVNENLFLKGYIGIYNTEGYSEKNYLNIAKFDSGELKRGDKGDYIWRTERVIGAKGWDREPWASRFPLFRKIMNQEKMRFYPIECDFSRNCFSGNFRNIEYRIRSGVKDVAKVPFIKSSDNREIEMSIFQDPKALDFRYRSGKPSGLPTIPFSEIGLKKDGYRKQLADKSEYRTKVQSHFEGQASYHPKARYDAKTINKQLYFNTGVLLKESGGFLHPAGL